MATPELNTAPASAGGSVVRTGLRWVLRIVLGLLIVLAVVLVSVSLVLRVERVQNWLLPLATQQISQALGTEVSIGHIRLDLPDLIVLEDIAIRDTFQQPLLVADELKVSTITASWLAFLNPDAEARRVSIREVVLENARANLYVKRNGVANYDFLFQSDTTDTTASPPLQLTFGDIRVRNLALRYIDSTSYNPNLRTSALDYANLALDSVFLRSSFEMPRSGRFSAEIQRLALVERRTGLRIHNLQTDLDLNLGPNPVDDPGEWRGTIASDSIPFIRFANSQLHVNQRTRLAFTADFRNETFGGLFQEANHPRQYRVEFDEAVMAFDDLNYFVPADPIPLAGVVGMDGVLTGDVQRLRGDRVTITYANDTRVQADLRLRDYTTPNIYLRVLLYPGSQVNPAEVDDLLTTADLPTELTRMGPTTVEGRFTGFVNDFVANIQASSRYGLVDADMNLKLPEDGPMAYSGTATTRNLNLNALLGGEANVSSQLNFTGRIEGQGSDLQTADTRFTFRADRSILAGYLLDSLGGDVRLNRGAITGTIRLNDPQGDFDGRVDINLNAERPTYFLVGDVANADLQHYGLTKDSVQLTTIFNVNLAGDSLDNLSGYVRLFQITLSREDGSQSRTFRDVVVSSRANSLQRKNLHIDSELLDLTLNGQFSYQQLGTLVRRLGNEATLWLANDTTRINAYYAQKQPVADSVRAAIKLQVHQLNPLLSFLQLPLRVSPGTELNADLAFGSVDRADVDLLAGTIAWDSISVRRVGLDLQVRKPSLQNNLVAEGLVTADSIYLPGGIAFTDFELAPNILNQAARVETRFSADSGRAHVKLTALARYANGIIDGRILAGSSGIVLRDSLWRFDPDNRIQYGENLLRIDNFRLTQAAQSLVIESNATPQDPGRLTLAARNLSVSQLTSIVLPGQPIYGVLNLTAVMQEPLSESPRLQVNGNIRRLQYENVRYGDLFLRARQELSEEGLAARVSLVRQRDTLLSVAGTYHAGRTGSPLDFRLATQNLPLNLVEPFVRNILYDLRGELTVSALHITGKLSSPQVRGEARLNDVTFGVDMFGTTYSLNGQLTFNQRSIDLGTVALRDANGNPATLRGTIFHDGFTDIRLDLALRDARNFLFMDTGAEENETFYGRAVIRDGRADIRGSFSNLSVNANIRTGEGTHIYIPLSDYQEANRLPYVFFKTSARDSVDMSTRLQGLEGLDLNLVVDATPDAQLTLVLDERTGDHIRGAGQGTLAVNINTNGEFRMYGTYEVLDGAYLMNLQGVLRREFNIEPPSNITWSGDPLAADLDIFGTYTVNADLSRLDANSGSNTAAITRPVEVLLYVKGSLLAPQVSFGLRVPNLSTENSLVLTSLLRTIENDPQELNKQVVSLLLYRQFAPQSNLFANDAGSNTVGSTASELLSGQLNNLLNNVFEGKLRVGLGTNNQFRDVNLNLQANLFNNRLTIERSGGLVGNTNRNVTIGNFRIAYRLLPGDEAMRTKTNPGILTVEVFNRENFGYNLSNTVITTSQGGGLFYRKDFETLAGLFNSRKPRDYNKPFDLPRNQAGQLDTAGLTIHPNVMGAGGRERGLEELFRAPAAPPAAPPDSTATRTAVQGAPRPSTQPIQEFGTRLETSPTPQLRRTPVQPGTPPATDTTRSARRVPAYLQFRQRQ